LLFSRLPAAQGQRGWRGKRSWERRWGGSGSYIQSSKLYEQDIPYLHSASRKCQHFAEVNAAERQRAMPLHLGLALQGSTPGASSLPPRVFLPSCMAEQLGSISRVSHVLEANHLAPDCDRVQYALSLQTIRVNAQLENAAISKDNRRVLECG
jgi:hypothetical protein